MTQILDTFEQDFRAWLAADTTPDIGIAALVGINVYFTAVPTLITGAFIGTRVAEKDGVTTTELGGGHLALAKVIVACCCRGVDPVVNYMKSKAVAQAVKARVNSVNGTWVMGATTVYWVTIDSKVEGQEGETEKDDGFNFHIGAESGIQCVEVPIAFHYWSPNS